MNSMAPQNAANTAMAIAASREGCDPSRDMQGVDHGEQTFR
jgi:hypothetical protein